MDTSRDVWDVYVAFHVHFTNILQHLHHFVLLLVFFSVSDTLDTSRDAWGVFHMF